MTKDGFHSVLANKIDERRSRIEAQNIHEDILTKVKTNQTSISSLMNFKMKKKSLETLDISLGGFERNLPVNPS